MPTFRLSRVLRPLAVAIFTRSNTGPGGRGRGREEVGLLSSFSSSSSATFTSAAVSPPQRVKSSLWSPGSSCKIWENLPPFGEEAARRVERSLASGRVPSEGQRGREGFSLPSCRRLASLFSVSSSSGLGEAKRRGAPSGQMPPPTRGSSRASPRFLRGRRRKRKKMTKAKRETTTEPCPRRRFRFRSRRCYRSSCPGTSAPAPPPPSIPPRGLPERPGQLPGPASPSKKKKKKKGEILFYSFFEFGSSGRRRRCRRACLSLPTTRHYRPTRGLSRGPTGPFLRRARRSGLSRPPRGREPAGWGRVKRRRRKRGGRGKVDGDARDRLKFVDVLLRRLFLPHRRLSLRRGAARRWRNGRRCHLDERDGRKKKRPFFGAPPFFSLPSRRKRRKSERDEERRRGSEIRLFFRPLLTFSLSSLAFFPSNHQTTRTKKWRPPSS